MSTYYYFACDRCKEYGGWFSRQAWGWGNFDIVDTFAFLAHHAEHVDHYQEGFELRVINEHDTYSMQRQGWTHIISDDLHAAAEHGERNANYSMATFPRSNDWQRAEELLALYKAQRSDCRK